MTPSFDVPAQYFYALTANLPTDVGVDIRYRLAVTADWKRLVDTVKSAIQAGVIDASSLITPEQAARRLAALGSAAGNATICDPGVGSFLVGQWLAFANPADDATHTSPNPDEDEAPFWDTVLVPHNGMTVTNATLADAHLQLVVCALIQEGDPTKLISAIRSTQRLDHSGTYTLVSVKDLDPSPWGGTGGLTYQDWFNIFQKNPTAIPAFAQVGTKPLPQGLAEMTSAFVRRLAQFFSVANLAPGASAPTAGARPLLPPPQFEGIGDPIGAFLANYQGLGFPGYAFGQAAPLDTTKGPIAARQVFRNDARAAEWLFQAASALNDLYFVTDVPTASPPVGPALRTALAESLYARGLTSVEQIRNLTLEDLSRTLVGTPAYPYAASIASKAGGPATPSTTGGGAPGPVNDGTLANCVPPPWLSPLGPVEYLAELLRLSEAATCEHPNGAPQTNPDAPTPQMLGEIVAKRRGPIGQLLATRANLETPLPMIDLVNEALETAVADGTVDVIYQTSDDALAGHPLGKPGVTPDEDAVPYRHDPAVLFDALPEHSSPGAASSTAYAKLRADFSAPVLPYAQSLDVSRAYLRELRSSRFATMRRFRKEITELVLDPDPSHQPADFPAHRWRYPVRFDIAREYLGITSDEYAQLFSGTLSPDQLAQLYGFPAGSGTSWMSTVQTLSELLVRTGLSYCEFLELWRTKIVTFGDRVRGREGPEPFPDCEPCYLDKHVVVFDGIPTDEALAKLAIVVRLWRKLCERRGREPAYTFSQIADIADVLVLFTSGATVNPDFVRQLAALQMLRDDFGLPLVDERASTSPADKGAARTHLLSLFVGPSAGEWKWAVDQLLDRVGRHARAAHDAHTRPTEFVKILASNLDPLSRLAGFDPADPTRTWFAHPTHVLRFAEVLSKVYASKFDVGELIYLFTVDDALEGDDPFPLPSEEESLDDPLDHPDDAGEHSLWALRRKLLEVEVGEEDARSWTWQRIEHALREQLGYPAAGSSGDPVLALGAHFFPGVLECAGTSVSAAGRRYVQPLDPSKTSPAMWNSPSDGPFRYDVGAKALWVELPLRDEAVLDKLARIRPLNDDEKPVVRDLYFAPRVDLAPFAFLFPNIEEAAAHLVENDESARWSYFQRCFARTHARCTIIARHLAAHVDAVTRSQRRDREHDEEHEGESTRLAWRLLRQLAADENAAVSPTTWQTDDGTVPSLTWPTPTGGAFAAILGLIGTGLLGELRVDGSSAVAWRELRGPLDAFGRVRNHWNVPIPTLLPDLGASLPATQAGLAGVRNGIVVTNGEGRPLGGVQGYCVRWHGVLLVEEAGPHEFFAGHRARGGKLPDPERAHGRRWRVTLRRGQKSWVVLTHAWPGEDGGRSTPLPLKRGAYEISVELERSAPDFKDADDVRAFHTGFELAYIGPDTDGRVEPLPLHRLFVDSKEGPLGRGLEERVQRAPKAFLDALYVSSLRDVRRTYQRAFKALLFARRFDLSAKPFADFSQSEIGCLLSAPDRFAGISFRPGTPWTSHKAKLDLNILPVRDPYEPPSHDDRANPFVWREQALFDIWERVFDYTRLRAEVRRVIEQPLWFLFDEAAQNPSEDPTQLVRHFGVNATYASVVLTFDVGYPVVTADLQDERWAVRAWRCHEWLRAVERECPVKSIESARPDLWAADDPATNGGNANLTQLVQDALVENGDRRRYEDLERLDDGLRQRARCALVAYLCGPNGAMASSAKALSESLLLDVQAGVREHASRIEEAVTAVQTFVARARLGLESWNPGPRFWSLWDATYATFRTWQACKRRSVYRENFIACDEIEAARRTEAFRFLESELRRATLTVPAPGGLVFWSGARPAEHPGLTLLQSREPSTMTSLPGQSEALDLLGAPERAARRSWLASIPVTQGDEPTPNPNPNPDPNPPGITMPVRSVPLSRALPPALAAVGAGASGPLPLWIESAIGLGRELLRVAGAGAPPASNPVAPRNGAGSAPCCNVCGRRHDAVVDEYYFWLVDSRYFSVDDEDASGNNPAVQNADADWHDDPGTVNADLPKLLAWAPQSSVYLVWARVHDGEARSPRRSTQSIPIAPGSTPKLQLDGRRLDSLYFAVDGVVWPPAGYLRQLAGTFDLVNGSTLVSTTSSQTGAVSVGDTLSFSSQPGVYYEVAAVTATQVTLATPYAGATAAAADATEGRRPGFRYDIATDAAFVVPQVSPETAGAPRIAGLSAYPYFVYFAPGAPLAPLSMFAESIAVACTLRAHCRFEAALDWYEATYDPVANDVRWCWQTVPQPPPPDGNPPGTTRPPSPRAPTREPEAREGERTCCRYGATTAEAARDRAIVLEYLETLVDWGDAAMRRNAPETFQHARLLFDTASKILGSRPITIFDHDDLPTPPPTVLGLVANPLGAPLNPRLMALYDRVADRLALVHEDLNARRRRNGRLHRDMPYWADDRRYERAWRGEAACCEGCGCRDCRCSDEGDWCCLPTPYRFTFLLQKATELAGEARNFGAALLAAFEKGDAEYLAQLRTTHEHQLTELALGVREDAWRAADWDVQSLKKAKESAQNQLQYYTMLIEGGLDPGELDYQGLMNGAIGSYTAATVSEALATLFGVIPDIFVGENNFTWLALGTKLAGVFNGIAQISSTAGQIQGQSAQLRLTQSSWNRRLVDWHHQVDQFTIQIEQIERQILAAERRRDSALHELNNTRVQIEQSREVLNQLRDRFTNHTLYLFLQKETAALHRQLYDLALRAAKQAERAFNFERGYTSRRFVNCDAWRDLREGLLAGEQLTLALRRMDTCYCDENVREYELTKHVSLRQLFPGEFLRLKLTGRCEIEIPEWLFDLDYPGQYMRRIRSVSLTVPCVVGPYTGVHCRLTLLSSVTRIAPWLLETVGSCCKDPPAPKPLPPPPCGCWSEPPRDMPRNGQEHRRMHGGYLPRPEDARIVRRYLAKEAIATSTGQNDSGMFELNFRDERYLPFELEGAVSRWRIELPPENNYFDVDTLSDVVLHLSYTAREGGDVLRRAAHEAAEVHLPDDGRRVIDVRQELSDEWRRFQAMSPDERARGLELPIQRDMFMFLPGHKDIWVTRIEVFFEAPDADPGDHHEIELVLGHRRECARGGDRDRTNADRDIQCVAGGATPGVFHGGVDVHLGPLTRGERDRLGVLKFGRSCGRISRMFLVVHYEAHARRPRKAENGDGLRRDEASRAQPGDAKTHAHRERAGR